MGFTLGRLLHKSVEILIDKGIVEYSKRLHRFSHRELIRNTPISNDTLFNIYTKKNYTFNSIKYECVEPPFKTLEIDPKDVNYRISWDSTEDSTLRNEKFTGIGMIKGGDWDSEEYRDPIEDIWKIKGFKQRFVLGNDWKNTIYYEMLEDMHIGSGKCEEHSFDTDREYIDSICSFYDGLYEDITKNGYERNHEGPRHREGIGLREQLEVLVTIGRDGEIYLWDGHHRFAIARILDIKIPVQVVCRHKKWQEYKDCLYKNKPYELETMVREHPDIETNPDRSANVK